MEQPEFSFPRTDLLGHPVPIHSMGAEERDRFIRHHIDLCNTAIRRAEIREKITSRRAHFARRHGHVRVSQILAIEGDKLILADQEKVIEVAIDDLDQVYQTLSAAENV